MARATKAAAADAAPTNDSAEAQHKRAPVPLTLYELTEEQRALDALVDMDEGEWSDEAEELFARLVEQMATKADDTGRYIRTREALAANIKLEEQRLAARRKAIEHHIKRLKEYIVFSLDRMGRDKIEGDMFTLSVQNNAPAAKAGPDADVSLLPELLTRYIPASFAPDMSAILAALKAGEDVPGYTLERGKHLRIR